LAYSKAFFKSVVLAKILLFISIFSISIQKKLSILTKMCNPGWRIIENNSRDPEIQRDPNIEI